MNKGDLTARTARLTGMAQKDVSLIINTAMEVMASWLEAGEKIQFLDFGSLSVKERAPRRGMNINTGRQIYIDAARTVCFKPGKELKERLNKQ